MSLLKLKAGTRRSCLPVAALALCMMLGWPAGSVSAHDHPGYSHDGGPQGNRKDWMSTVPDERKLSQMSLPGTHDTMSDAQGGGDIAQNQSMSLADQLTSGIRVLDIRIRHIGDSFALHHGSLFLNKFFGDGVLKVVCNFLSAHPRETVVISIDTATPPATNNSPGATLDTQMAAYMAAAFTPPAGSAPATAGWNKYDDFRWKDYVTPAGYLGDKNGLTPPTATNDNPTLGQLRGKFVFIQDFGYPNRTNGTNGPDVQWGLDKKLIESAGNWVHENYWDLATNWDLYDKWANGGGTSGNIGIKPRLLQADVATTENFDKFYFIGLAAASGGFPYFFASGHSSPGTSAPRLSTGLTTPGWASSYPDFPRTTCFWFFTEICTISFEGTNILTTNFINAGGIRRRAGIVSSDFPGSGLIGAIVNLNYNTPPASADAGGPYVVNEGSPVIFDGSGSNDPNGETLQYRWQYEWPGGGFSWDTLYSSAPTSSHTWQDDHEGLAVVEVKNSGATSTDFADVTVLNVFPGLAVTRTLLVECGSSASLSGEFSDPGSGDTHHVKIDWGDGSMDEGGDTVHGGTGGLVSFVPDGNSAGGVGSFLGEHLYANVERTYDATVRLLDDEQLRAPQEWTDIRARLKDEHDAYVLKQTELDPNFVPDPFDHPLTIALDDFPKTPVTVTVQDTTPPTITSCPPTQGPFECNSHGGRSLDYAIDFAGFPATATDTCRSVVITYDPPSGHTFPLGVTTVTVTATDVPPPGATTPANVSTCTFDVEIADTTPPTLTCGLTRTLLWPVQNGLLPVGFSAAATDVCDANPVITIEVFSDEPNGPAPYSPDARDLDYAASLHLRAERQYPGNGRVYVVRITATDGSNNKTVDYKTSVVPLMPVGLWTMRVTQEAAAAEAAFRAAGAGPAPAGYTLVHALTVP